VLVASLKVMVRESPFCVKFEPSMIDENPVETVTASLRGLSHVPEFRQKLSYRAKSSCGSLVVPSGWTECARVDNDKITVLNCFELRFQVLKWHASYYEPQTLAHSIPSDLKSYPRGKYSEHMTCSRSDFDPLYVPGLCCMTLDRQVLAFR
jgi:hypothetical protein